MESEVLVKIAKNAIFASNSIKKSFASTFS
jgi:hypothetical protein